ncbi:MAG: hypothetical protein PHI85_04540 [Victivallaceae bacterium]|nr:hypothetical protein [Victivallaceae bacterium]
MKKFKKYFRQFLMAATAAVFAASGLLHPLFHREYGGAVQEALFSGDTAAQPEFAAASTACRPPEFVPDFCPICSASLVCAALPAFDWAAPRPVAAQFMCADSSPGLDETLTHQARAPPVFFC